MWHHSSKHICSAPLLPPPLPTACSPALSPQRPSPRCLHTLQLISSKAPPSCTKLFWRRIIPQSSSLLTVLVWHVVQMGSGQHTWVISSPMLQDGSKAGSWPSHCCCMLFTLLFSEDIWAPQRTQGKVKSEVSPAVAFPLLASCPAGQSSAASTKHANLPLKEKKVNLQQARALPHGCPLTAEISSESLCINTSSSLPTWSHFRSITSGITVHWAFLLL